MWKTLVPIAVGVCVGVAAAIAAFGIFMGVVWGQIHSGRTDRPGALETAMGQVAVLCAAAVPIALGILASWATRWAIAKRAPTVSSD